MCPYCTKTGHWQRVITAVQCHKVKCIPFPNRHFTHCNQSTDVRTTLIYSVGQTSKGQIHWYVTHRDKLLIQNRIWWRRVCFIWTLKPKTSIIYHPFYWISNWSKFMASIASNIIKLSKYQIIKLSNFLLFICLPLQVVASSIHWA